ncbi:MAG: GDP-mannose 4,6-dehydratase, partial [bacterium]
GKQEKIYLGNLEAKRDWGYAPEYVEAMWLMLQQDKPDDYVIGTGQTHSIKEFLQEAFSYVELNWKDYIEIDMRYFRPTEVEFLQADITKTKERLKWEPKTGFRDLVKIMVDSDMRLEGLTPIGEGEKILKEKGIS